MTFAHNYIKLHFIHNHLYLYTITQIHLVCQQFCNTTTFLVIHDHHQVARCPSFAFIFLTAVQLLRNEVLKKWSLREAIVQKIPEFYEICSQTVGGSTGFHISYSEIIKLVKPSIFQRPTHFRIAFIIF